jgi:hypothetical protein
MTSFLRSAFVLLSVWTSGLAYSAPTFYDVVIDVEGTLVQGVPKDKVTNYPADELIEAAGKTYRIAPYARSLLFQLSRQPNVRVSFFSEESEDATNGILQKLMLSAPDSKRSAKDIAFKVLNKTDLTSSAKKDLTKISSNLDRVILVDDNPDITPTQQSRNVASVGPSYFAFETFDSASAELARLTQQNAKGLEAMKHRFPPDPESWERERGKLARAFALLSEALDEARSGKSTLTTAASWRASLAKDPFIKKGEEKIAKYYSWTYTGGGSDRKATGCEERTLVNSEKRTVVPFQLCVMNAPLTYRWGGPKGIQCEKLTDDSVSIAFVPVDVCLGVLPFRYYWTDETYKKCGLYTDQRRYLKAAPFEQCDRANPMVCSISDGVLKPQQRALIASVQGDVLPQILALAKGAPIPDEVLKSKDSRVVALSLVRRLYEAKDKALEAPAGKATVDPMKDFEIQMLFNSGLIDAIQKDCFQNTHQVKRDASYNNSRKIYEDRLAQIQAETQYASGQNPGNRLRPKYAYLGTARDVPTVRQDGLGFQSAYGNMVAVFKDDVKLRSTFAAVESNTPADRRADAHTFFFKPTSMNRPSDLMWWEAQIWGEICFSDVEYVMVSCNFIGVLPEDEIMRLRALNIPVYQCETDGRRMWPGKKL